MNCKFVDLSFAVSTLKPLQQVLKLQSCGLLGLFFPSNAFAFRFPASRSERTVASTIRRALVCKMELQLVLLFAGIIAFSDSARGKETGRAADAPPLTPFPLLRRARAPRTPAVPSEGPVRVLPSARTHPRHVAYLRGAADWCPRVVPPYLRVSGLLVWTEHGRCGLAEVSQVQVAFGGVFSRACVKIHRQF